MGGVTGKEKIMDEMNATEELKNQTEEKMLYKILYLIKDCKTKDEVEQIIKNLLKK